MQLLYFRQDQTLVSDFEQLKSGDFVEGSDCRRAIVSMLQNSLYVGNALVLGHSLRKHNPTLGAEGIDQILLVPFDHDLSPTNLTRLREVGWTIRHEHDVKVKGMETLQRHYRRNFMKLRLWGWTNYTKIGYIDADCLIRGDVRLLVSDDFGKKLILFC